MFSKLRPRSQPWVRCQIMSQLLLRKVSKAKFLDLNRKISLNENNMSHTRLNNLKNLLHNNLNMSHTRLKFQHPSLRAQSEVESRFFLITKKKFVGELNLIS